MAERRDLFDEWFQTQMALNCAAMTMAMHLFRLQQELMFGPPLSSGAQRETEARPRVAQDHARAAPQPPRPSTSPSFVSAKAAFAKAPNAVMKLGLVKPSENQPSDSPGPSSPAALQEGSSRGLSR